ncbi:MAG: caspase family protein [Sterolibacterium sp.]|nr:caspase family protein [Sterolibacterium sp.]
MGIFLRFLLLVASISCGLAYAADGRNLGVRATAVRVALVIGNSSYPGSAALKNPANDATDVAGKLRRLNFNVTLKTNVGLKEMLRALTAFGDKVQQGSEVLFFYAGHGMQVHGKNYLIPVDAEIKSEGSVSSEAVDVDQLLDKLAQARLSIVILDACRNNPFERRFRGSGQGLAQINAPTGTLIAYATAPGKVASDGEGRNGLYTSELLASMDVPGIRIEDVFKRVRSNVVRKSNEAQIPWESSSLTGDFFFMTTGVESAPAMQAASSPSDPTAVELAYWNGVKDSRDTDAFKAYLDQYPDGRFASLAKVRMRELSGTPPEDGQRTSATDFLEGMWEYQMPDNYAHVQVYWNPKAAQYEAILMHHGKISQWVGFVMGEVVWKAKPTSDPKRLQESQLTRVGSNGVSISQQWLEGELHLDRSSPDELVTSFGKLRRIGPGSGAGTQTAGRQEKGVVERALAGRWVAQDGAIYQLAQDGTRLTLRTDSRPISDDEVRSTYTLVGNVPITQPNHAEFHLLLDGKRLSGSWNRAPIPAEKCIVPAATSQVEGELKDREGTMALRYARTSYKAATQLALLGDDTCSGVATLGTKTVEDVLYGPLGRGGIGGSIYGLTSWWDGGMSAIKFGWQGRLGIRVQEGSSAYLAGLRDNDEILAIDGVYLKNLTAGEAMVRLHGEPLSSVTLEVKRKDEAAPVSLKVQRVE